MTHTITCFIENIFIKRIDKFLFGEWITRKPNNLSLIEAKQFVASFVAEKYAPDEYEAFLRWLKGATIDELGAIADEHEALHELWSLPSVGPSPEWISKLELKLDKASETDPDRAVLSTCR